jgi:geranylgeranyl reductase family protein
VRRYDAVIVGGGPAGSTCARALRSAGWSVVVIDRARFPRDKVCAGWVTPEVFQLLDLAPADYRATGLTLQQISGFKTGLLAERSRRQSEPSIETRYPSPISYAIRRCEFDHFLLKRAAVPVLEGTSVNALRRRGDTWVVNDELEAPLLIGAGGHFCPVARHLQGGRAEAAPIVAKELEFRLDGHASTVPQNTPELFFCRDLEGYAWCVRKGDYLNIGIGRRNRGDFGAHVREFGEFLVETGRAPETTRCVWHGHAYHASGAGTRRVLADGALLIGDAAGLAYPESGEGIRPAVESGALAARTLIAAGGRHALVDLEPYEAELRARYPRSGPGPAWVRPFSKSAGRALLRHSRWFTRHFVVEKWFLRSGSRSG